MGLLKYKLSDGWKTLYGGALANILRKDKNLSDLSDRATARANLELTGDDNTTHYHDSRYLSKINIAQETANAAIIDVAKMKQELSLALAKVENMASRLFSVGMIIDWCGPVEEIPLGWRLCDGSKCPLPNNPDFMLPNLCDRFTVGAGNLYPVKSSGGEPEHQITTDEMPIHNHNAWTDGQGNHQHYTIDGLSTASFLVHDAAVNNSVIDIYYGDDGRYAGNAMNAVTSWAGHHGHNVGIGNTGGGQPHNNMPPYYAVYKIMFVGFNS